MNLLFDDVNVFEILDSVNIGIWIIEYSKNKNIYKLYPNKTFLKIMDMDKLKDKTPESYYRYWENNIDDYYLDNVHMCLYNMMKMYDEDSTSYKTDEVHYVWHHENKGNINIRCGGKVIEYNDGVYKMCGYHQDYSDIIKLKDKLREKESIKFKEEIKNITNQKSYYKKLAYIDELTQLINRRGFYDKIRDIMVNRMRRTNDHLWISILDIDYFKKVNDSLGHLSGDIVLKYVGKSLLELSKKYKGIYVFRYGGEEFIVLIYQRTYNQIKEILNNFRHEIEEANIIVDKEKLVKITCSIGVTNVRMLKNFSIEANIYKGVKEADEALYVAKNGGRNKVVIKL